MSGLEGLASIIYHEKQQPGSMLCAQHALNSLLQGNYFTAPDLSSIALSLDSLEDSYRDEDEQESRNMDDTGFFSVQVLDNALKVWGLDLVRWRSEEMRPYNEKPHTQLAFILNLEQHWFTLRRFGPAVPKIDEDPGAGHWFNLNSFLSAPEWVGKLYLGMVLQQAETEGYSVFAVTQDDPNGPLALPRTEADEIAATLPEPSSASPSISTTRTPRNAMQASSSSTPAAAGGAGDDHFDDEDYELQMALQASLAHHDPDAMELDDASSPPPLTRGTVPLPPSAMQTPSFTAPHTPIPTGSFPSGPAVDEDEDPVAASMARNRQLLERMQQEQAYAARELWTEDDLPPEDAEALRARREARQRQEEQEEAELRRAIEESEKMAQQQQHGRGQTSASRTHEDDDDSDEEIVEDDLLGREPRAGSASNLTPAYYGNDRVYDDDDAMLQAALKASLEGLPPGFEHPEAPGNIPYIDTSQAAATTAPSAMAQKDQDDNVSVASETSASEAPEPVEEEPLSVDEIRRRRLARFGA